MVGSHSLAHQRPLPSQLAIYPSYVKLSIDADHNIYFAHMCRRHFQLTYVLAFIFSNYLDFYFSHMDVTLEQRMVYCLKLLILTEIAMEMDLTYKSQHYYYYSSTAAKVVVLLNMAPPVKFSQSSICYGTLQLSLQCTL